MFPFRRNYLQLLHQRSIVRLRVSDSFNGDISAHLLFIVHQITNSLYQCVFRHYTKMYRCLNDMLTHKCDFVAAVIYTDYHVRVTKRWLASIDCYVSE